jgi:carboxylesterase
MLNKNYSNKFDTNNYLFNSNSRLGIYLIHGFSSTTYEVKKLADYLGKQGFRVKADNLPGHGTSIADCNITKYTEWLCSVEQGIAEMYSACDKVIVIGVSMGAVLSLHLGTLFPVDGIIAASAVFKFKNEFNVRIINRLFHRIKKTIPKQSTFNPDQVKVKKIQFYGYNKYPLSALNEMRKMVDKVKLNLHKISSPILLIHSTIDQTSPMKNFQIIQDCLTTQSLETLVLNKTGHNVFDTELDDKKLIFSTIDTFINKIFNAK